MKLTIFNGSPRGNTSNTRTILDAFLQGFMSTDGNSYELSYLIHTEKREEQVAMFKNARYVLLAFPLYVDAMPFVVKSFIESLEPLCDEKFNPDIGFIVQSGFPETAHSRYLERYLGKLALRLKCGYKGTVIRGGGEAIKLLALLDNIFLLWFCKFSASTNFANVGHLLDKEKLTRSFHALGKEFGVTGEFDDDIVTDLTEPDRIGAFSFWAFKFVTHNLYWDLLLRKNNVFAERFARPYIR
jgi:hypothetical protein